MREGEELLLPPRTFELLLALAHCYPRHVRRHDLLEAVWPTEVVTDQTLSHRVLLLRRALGDDTEHPRYVASDRGWGYRLVAPVEALEPELEPQPVGQPARRGWLRSPLATAAALGLAGGLAAMLCTYRLRPDQAAARPDEVRRLCLQGEWLMRSWQGPSLQQATRVYERALALDPRAPSAHAGLAITYATQALLAEKPAPDIADRARAAALQAARLSPEHAASLVAAGLVKLTFDTDISGAEKALRHAFNKDPDSLVARAAWGFFLQSVGRIDDSLLVLERAQATDPHAAPFPYLVGRGHHLARRCARALESFGRALELDPYLRVALLAAADCHSDLDDGDAALSALLRERGLAGAGQPTLRLLEEAYVRGGLVDLWLQVCEREDARPKLPLRAALACARGQREDRVWLWIERSLESWPLTRQSVRQERAFDSLRASPTYQKLLRRDGLPPPGR